MLVGTLAAGASSNVSISITVPSTAGTYYYGACVDPVAGEVQTANNCSSGVRVAVTASGLQNLLLGAWIFSETNEGTTETTTATFTEDSLIFDLESSGTISFTATLSYTNITYGDNQFMVSGGSFDLSRYDSCARSNDSL